MGSPRPQPEWSGPSPCMPHVVVAGSCGLRVVCSCDEREILSQADDPCLTRVLMIHRSLTLGRCHQVRVRARFLFTQRGW